MATGQMGTAPAEAKAARRRPPARAGIGILRTAPGSLGCPEVARQLTAECGLGEDRAVAWRVEV